MSGKESKRSKGRRTLSSHSKISPNSTPAAHSVIPNAGALGLGATGGAPPSPLQPFGPKLTMNVCDVATEFGLNLKPSVDEVDLSATKLMDTPADMSTPTWFLNGGQNPYLEQCMYCSTPRSEAQDGDEGLELLDLQLDGNAVISGSADSQSFSSLKLEIWTCSKCRKLAGSNFQTFLEANLPQPAYELPSFLHDREACVDTMSCLKCQEELSFHEQETKELQDNWVELRSVVSDIYASEKVPSLTENEGDRLKFLVDKLCSRDPHQLFLRLDSQAREVVVCIKKKLLTQLNEYPQGCPSSPQEALAFTSSLLEHHELLTRKSHLLARYLSGMSEHLKRFKVTWELLNKHLFHSIVHSDPSISKCGPTILEQLRQGSVLQEKSRDDPYCVVRKELIKFQNEMAVVEVVWRDCRQLIENYCQEEVKNTQKQVQILREHLIKEPLMDEALSETMRNLISGHKSSAERVMCHKCKRDRCTCDECTITHMITCGNMNAAPEGSGDKTELSHTVPNSFNFALDHTVRNMVMDITPPSMSSTTSSSGSVSPINIEDKLTTFYDCEKEEFNDALLNPAMGEGQTLGITADDIDENAGDDEEEEEDEEPCGFADTQDAECDEPHALQVPIIELKDADAAHAALWEAVQQQQQVMFEQELGTQHNCAQCHQGQQCAFQPQLDPELSRQLDAELAKNGLLPSQDLLEETLPAPDNGGGGEGLLPGEANPAGAGGLRPACQCHACLKQSGQVISTSLPLQVPVSPPPAELHLYPHIHGLPQQHQQRYTTFDLPSSLVPPIKLPVKLDFNDPSGLQDHIYHVYSDWDNSLQPRPGSLAAQHQHQQRLSALSPDLLPPAPLTSLDSFSLASSPTNTSASAFKSVAGKHLAASVLPTLGSLGASFTTTTTGEGSSVDPTKAAALDFASLFKLQVSCLNSSSSAPPAAFSSSSSSSGTSLSTSSPPSAPPVSSCHGPPCSRPAPVGGNEAATGKWERSHPLLCKKQPVASSVGGMLPTHGGVQPSHPVHPFKGSNHAQGAPPAQAVLKNLLPAATAPNTGARTREDGHKPYRSMLQCSHNTTPPPPLKTTSPSPSTPPTPPHPSPSPACSGSNVPSVVNNIGVGTCGPCTGEHTCDGHHGDDNCDSIDDSCSEKSSTASTNNQKEGKYCDCCYCEFFGHNNTQVAKTSTNYAQMKDRLQKKLKKRQTEKQGPNGPKNGLLPNEKDPLEKKGLEGLLSFINGTEGHVGDIGKDKELTAKAAKRARQKQRKLEEKAKQDKGCEESEKPPIDRNLQQLISQALSFSSQVNPSMGKPKLKKVRSADKSSVQASPVCSQEIPRSSLIIESTRPTISRSPKDGERTGTVSSQPNGLTNNSKGANPQDMMNLIQTFKQQQQQQSQTKKVVSSSSIPTPGTKMSSSQAKSNEVKSSTAPKPNPSSKENNKEPSNTASKNQRTAQPQPLTSKSVNGKVAPSLTQSQPSSTTNGKTGGAEKRSHQATASHSQQSSVPNGSVKNGGHAISKGGVSGKTVSSSSVFPDRSAAPPPVNSSASPTPNKSSVADSPGAGSVSSSSSLSPPAGSKPADQAKPSGKTKKNKKKNKNGDLSCVDEIFMPKPEGELDGDVDDFERELEEFKRFCFEPADIKERRKLAVNVNLKDIFKKKSGMV